MADKVNAPQIKLAYLEGLTRAHAQDCDKNNNGVIDPAEIKLFQSRVDVVKDEDYMELAYGDKQEVTVIRNNFEFPKKTVAVSYYNQLFQKPVKDADFNKITLFDANDKPRVVLNNMNETVTVLGDDGKKLSFDSSTLIPKNK